MTPALVGRRRELSVIGEFLSACCTSGGSLILLGEPGAGKPALLDVAAEEAVRQGTQVLRASGTAFDVGIGYAGIHQVLMPLLDREWPRPRPLLRRWTAHLFENRRP